MKTLLTLFDRERNSLKTEIDRATNLDQVVRLVQNRLDNLERVYLGELNITQVRLAALFLETLRQSIAALTVAYETENVSSQTSPSLKAAGNLSPNRLILKGLQALVCLGILGSLFSLTPRVPGAWMAILLTALLIGIEVVFQLDKTAGENSTTLPQLPETSLPVVRVDSQVLLDNLADALHTIDEAVSRAKDVNKSLDSSGIEELTDLLNLIQRLMGASFLNKPQMAVELAKLLPQVLREQGIHAQLYRPEETANVREFFDFEPTIDPTNKDYVTITPALLKGERLLLKGRVIEPAPPKD